VRQGPTKVGLSNESVTSFAQHPPLAGVFYVSIRDRGYQCNSECKWVRLTSSILM
jgi:hypothetical protein